MNENEQEIAAAIYGAIQQSSTQSERSQQSDNFRIGPSDLGHCSEKVRRMIANIPEPPTGDKLEAFIGTALGDHVEQAVIKYLWPDAIVQSEVTATVIGDRGTYEISGHPDIIWRHRVIDVKTKNGLDIPRRNGPNQQQQFQRHLYAYGAYQAGLLHVSDPDKPGMSRPATLDEVEVANFWLDRSGEDKNPVVQMEPFSMEVVNEAAWWLDDVVERYLAGEEANKEPHYNFCAGWCGHFADCRAGEGDVTGLITDPELLAAVDLLQEAKALESEAKRMKNKASVALKGVEGSTGAFSIKWTHVNGGHVSYDREGYLKLDVRKIR